MLRSKSPKRPQTRAFIKAPKNDGITVTIKRTPSSIGHIEYGHARVTGATSAMLENATGEYVASGPGFGEVALAGRGVRRVARPHGRFRCPHARPLRAGEGQRDAAVATDGDGDAAVAVILSEPVRTHPVPMPSPTNGITFLAHLSPTAAAVPSANQGLSR